MPRLSNTLTALSAGLACALLMLAGCDAPRDPEDTTEKVTGAVLLVGWVAGAEPSEIEREAVAQLASRLGAAVEARDGPVHRLIAELEDGMLHVVGGELPEKTPFAAELGLSKPVGTVVLRGEVQPSVMAIRAGENRFLLLLNEAIAKAKR